MTKKLIFLAFLMLLGSIALGQTIPNGGFESWSGGTPDSWTTIDSGLSVSQETNPLHVTEGSSSIKINVTSTSNSRTDFRQVVTLPAGVHNINVRVKGTAGINQAKMYVNAYTNSVSDHNIVDEWQTVSYTLTLSSQTNVTIGFRFYDQSGTYSGSYPGEIFYIDDFRIGAPAPVEPTVSIAPTAKQTIEQNDVATQLTATEELADDTIVSRVWGYRTVSEGAITALAETGATYTPNTTEIGTKYYVCSTTFTNAGVKISNEVEVEVTEPVDELYNESVSSWTPAGWDVNGGWTSNSSSNAGGTSPEAMLKYNAANGGESFTLPAINTSGRTSATISWKQKLDWYRSNYFTIKVYSSTDNTSFNQIYTYDCSADEVSAPSVTIGADEGVGAASLYFKFEFAYKGTDSFSYWYVDDIKVVSPVLAATNDTDSGVRIYTNSATMHTNNPSYNGFTAAAGMEIFDSGSGDGLPTKITRLKFYNNNLPNGLDLTTAVSEAKLMDGPESVIPTTNATVTNEYVQFDLAAGALEIADGASKQLAVALFYANGALYDGAEVELSVNPENHGWMTDPSGSSFGATLQTSAFVPPATRVVPEVSNNFTHVTFDVVATNIKFDAQPTNVEIDAIMNPNVTVKCYDDYENFDAGLNGTMVNLTANTATFAGSATTQSNFVNGVATFSNLVFSGVANNATLTAAYVSTPTRAVDPLETATDTSNTFNVTEPVIRPNIIISEIADPRDQYAGRFVEIYNASNQTINFDTEPNNNWAIKLFVNGNSSASTTINLTGILPAYSAFVIGDKLEENYDVNADIDRAITGNGDDCYALYQGDELIDIYGVIGEDGSGKNWEYTDARVVRKRNITEPNNTFTISEWHIRDNSNLSDMTPGSYGGETGSSNHANADVPTGDVETEIPGATVNSKVVIKHNNPAPVQIGITAYEQQQPSAPVQDFTPANQWWEIDVSDQAATLTLKFYYDEALLNGVAEADLVVWHFNGTAWVNIGGVVNAIENYIEVVDYNGGFSPFTVGDMGILPVEFSSFSASLTANNFVNLTWVVHSESNLSGYTVYKNTNPNFVYAEQVNASLISATNESVSHAYSYTDKDVEQGKYYYWLESLELDGTSVLHGPTSVEVKFGNDDNNDGDTPEVVYTNQLIGNSPNPFNPSTDIMFSVTTPGFVSFDIYNVKGQKVKTLSKQALGNKLEKITWNGTDNSGKTVSTGIYFYKMKAGKFTQFKKMIMVK